MVPVSGSTELGEFGAIVGVDSVIGNISVVAGDLAVADSVDTCCDYAAIEGTPFPGVLGIVADADRTALEASTEVAPQIEPRLEVVVGTVDAEDAVE